MPITRQFSNALDQTGLVDCIRQLGHDDAVLAAFHLLEVGLGLHDNFSAPRAVCRLDPLFAFLLDNEAARWEVRTLHKLHQLLNIDIVQLLPAIQHIHDRVDDLAQIMRRDGGGHAHCNPCRAVDQKIRQRSRQYTWFFQGIVEVRGEVNCFLVQVEQNIQRSACKARFGITHRRGRIAVDGPKVSLPVHQHGAHREILCEACHGFIHR